MTQKRLDIHVATAAEIKWPAILKHSNTLQCLKVTVDDQSLVALPDDIDQLQHLRMLFIENCGLQNLPETLRQLSHLETLWISGNQIEALPEWIGDLTTLTDIRVSHNKLTLLPDTIGHLTHLSRLVAGHNQITILPKSIKHLKSLETLFLNNNAFTDLPAEIGELKSLKSLYVMYNRLKTLPPEISSLQNVPSLNLTGNPITHLPQEIAAMALLYHLQFGENGTKKSVVIDRHKPASTRKRQIKDGLSEIKANIILTDMKIRFLSAPLYTPLKMQILQHVLQARCQSDHTAGLSEKIQSQALLYQPQLARCAIKGYAVNKAEQEKAHYYFDALLNSTLKRQELKTMQKDLRQQYVKRKFRNNIKKIMHLSV